MKKLIFIFLIFTTTIFSQNHPIVGENFTIKYNPLDKGILSQEAEISVVYIFDYWGKLPSANNVASEMFKNVLQPEDGHTTKVKMQKQGKEFSAVVNIPDSISLLSYFFTDGEKTDYNDNKTYYQLVYNKNNIPVKGARFRELDFMVMADKSLDEQIQAIKEEIDNYPENQLARFVYWQKQFSRADKFEELQTLFEKAKKSFEITKEKYPNDYELLNAEGKTYIALQSSVSRILSEFYQNINKDIISICEQIPERERSSLLKRVFEANLRRENSEKFNKEIVKKEAPDFQFVTLDGKKKKLSDYKGKYVLLDFWGTWCGPCVGEIPNLKKNYELFKKKGFTIISISSDLLMKTKTEEEFKEFINKQKMDWPQVLNSEKIINQYNIINWPTLFLIDKKGVVIHNEVDLRGDGLGKTLEKYLK